MVQLITLEVDMLDIKFIRDNPNQVKEMLLRRNINDINIDSVIALYEKQLQKNHDVQSLRAERNALAKNPTKESQERGKTLKNELKNVEDALCVIDEELKDALLRIPNMLHPDVPNGKDDSENVPLRYWGKIPELDFDPKDHEQLGIDLDLIDLVKGSQLSGSGFYYLKNDAVLLEFALVRFALDILMENGFTPMITPELVRREHAASTGYLPKREAPDIYKIENEDMFLIATAEIPLAAYHANEIIPHQELPKKYTGFSSCFRKEAGAHGRHKKGIFRVHQFDKVEMFAFSEPQKSMEMFYTFIDLSEKIFQGLKIPYRVVNICTGDMNGPGYIKYDLEYYSPIDKAYREMTSGTNTTDYQARRLNIRVRKQDGSVEFVHTLNNTAIAISRTLIALMENYQQSDGTIAIPEVLQKYIGKDVIRKA